MVGCVVIYHWSAWADIMILHSLIRKVKSFSSRSCEHIRRSPMAKIKAKAPFSGFSGAIGTTDKSRGRGGGSVVLSKLPKQKWLLRVKKVKEKKRSPKQIARDQRYCFCDQRWKMMRSDRMFRLVSWWMWARNLKQWQYPAYQTWMHGCLKSLPEMDLFYVFCWVGRYRFTNETGANLPSQAIRLLDVRYLDSSGTDNEVWTLLPNSFLGENVPRDVVAPGTLEIIMPALPPGGSLAWDVYSYAGG